MLAHASRVVSRHELLITYPKLAFKRPPRVSPVRRAISSVAKDNMAASGMMAMKLTTKTAIGFMFGMAPSTMPIGAATSRTLIQEFSRVRWIWFATVNGVLGWTCLNILWSFLFFFSGSSPSSGVKPSPVFLFRMPPDSRTVASAVVLCEGTTVSPLLSVRTGTWKSTSFSLLGLPFA